MARTKRSRKKRSGGYTEQHVAQLTHGLEIAGYGFVDGRDRTEVYSAMREAWPVLQPQCYELLEAYHDRGQFVGIREPWGVRFDAE